MNLYSIIYADPAWQYEVWSDKGKGRSADKHYSISSNQYLLDLGEYVKKVTAKDAMLLMWITAPTLPFSLQVIEAWGFTYKTIGFTWVKRTKTSEKFFFGQGYYTRANTELCFLATKGKPLFRNDKGVSQVISDIPANEITQPIFDPIMRHSEKPVSVHEAIERLVGKEVPKLELFARKKRDGWTCLGNEITGNDLTVDLQNIYEGKEYA